VALLLAVLDRRTRIDLLSQDVYAKAAGGVRVAEPAADLGIAMAIASSRLDRAVPADTAAVGEIGLGGEVRRVARLDVRLAEVARLGFRRLLVPAVCHREHLERRSKDSARSTTRGRGKFNCELVPIEEVAQAVDWLEQNGVAGSF
jgi:predicted ATP-dependent serine protease